MTLFNKKVSVKGNFKPLNVIKITLENGDPIVNVRILKVWYKRSSSPRLKQGEFFQSGKVIFICSSQKLHNPMIMLDVRGDYDPIDDNDFTVKVKKTSTRHDVLCYGARKTKSKIKWGSSPPKIPGPDSTVRVRLHKDDYLEAEGNTMLLHRKGQPPMVALITQDNQWSLTTAFVAYLVTIGDYRHYLNKIEQLFLRDGYKPNLKYELIKGQLRP
jgi:hypothetical protein